MSVAKTVQTFAPYALGAAAGFAVVLAVDPADNLEEIRLVSEFSGAKDGVSRREKTLASLQAAAAITGILAALSAGARCGGKWTRALLPFAVGAAAGYLYTSHK